MLAGPGGCSVFGRRISKQEDSYLQSDHSRVRQRLAGEVDWAVMAIRMYLTSFLQNMNRFAVPNALAKSTRWALFV